MYYPSRIRLILLSLAKKNKIVSYHFFSGIGLGTVFTLQGTLGAPYRFLPNTVPTNVNGRITKITMAVTASCI